MTHNETLPPPTDTATAVTTTPPPLTEPEPTPAADDTAPTAAPTAPTADYTATVAPTATAATTATAAPTATAATTATAVPPDHYKQQLTTQVLDKCHFTVNEIREAIRNNLPIEENLHVIAVISNPCLFKRRYQLMRDFIRRMDYEENVILYIVELAYKEQPFGITSAKNPRHLQLRTETTLWHKENMINLGVKHLLPADWKAMAWVDADIDFENITWAADTLRVLNGCRDVVQLFSHAIDMDSDETTMNVYNSFAFQYCKNMPYSYKFPNYWHPGFCWAVNRATYDKMGGVFELGILGSSDHIMSFCFMNKGIMSINDKYTEGFKQEILEFQKRVKNLRMGYIPGVIRHYFHGSKINRKYVERNEILLRHGYDPKIHIARDKIGILVPAPGFSTEFGTEIFEYFRQRNEDE
jgi:hypothetical protein